MPNLTEIAARIMELAEDDPMGEDATTEVIELAIVLASHVAERG